jgi:hypothetical protein
MASTPIDELIGELTRQPLPHEHGESIFEPTDDWMSGFDSVEPIVRARGSIPVMPYVRSSVAALSRDISTSVAPVCAFVVAAALLGVFCARRASRPPSTSPDNHIVMEVVATGASPPPTATAEPTGPLWHPWPVEPTFTTPPKRALRAPKNKRRDRRPGD